MRITTERLEELLDRLRTNGGPPRMPPAHFNDAQFAGGDTHFDETQFSGDAHFDGVQFSGDAHFDGARFSGEADFRRARFSAEADFRRTTFAGEGRFDQALFAGEARFGEARFSGDVDFGRAQFSGTHHLGPLTTPASLVLSGVVFLEHVTVVVRAARLLAVDTRFRSGTDILAQSALMEFDRAAFGATSTVGPATSQNAPTSFLTKEYGDEEIPCVISLRGARIVDLAISGVDLRTCCFRGAHGLASLRLEQVLLAEPPEGWRKARRGPIPIRWTRRVAIAEEHHWRKKDYGWPRPDRMSLSETEPPNPTPHQIAAIYRSLRKGQEERKDEPGAADFYYGEMEMRRHSTYKEDEALRSKPPYRAPSLKEWTEYDNTRRTPRAEKFVLWLYWSTSGYGLRASRALAALGVTIVSTALLLWLFGFEDRSNYLDSLLFAMKGSVSLLRAPEEEDLTPGGEVVAIALRLLGPLFFGLALLSLRGRIKR